MKLKLPYLYVCVLMPFLACLSVSKRKNPFPDIPNKGFFLGYYTLHPVFRDTSNWTPQTWDIIRRHTVFLDSLGKEGVLIFAGRTQYPIGHTHLFGITLLRYSHSLDSLKALMAKDPSVVNLVQMQQIHPYSLGIQHFEQLSEAKIQQNHH